MYGKSTPKLIQAIMSRRTRVVRTLKKPHGEEFEPGPVKLFINDVSFTKYRVFRSESRIIANGVN